MRRIFNYTSVELHTISVITRSVWNACIYHYNIIQCSRVWTKSSSDCSATNFLFQPCLTYIWTLFSISSLNMHPMWTLKADVVQWLACNKKCGCILMQSLPRENCYIKLYKGAKVYPVLHISLKASRLVECAPPNYFKTGHYCSILFHKSMRLEMFISHLFQKSLETTRSQISQNF